MSLIGVGDRGQGIQFARLRNFGHRLISAAEKEEQVGDPMMCLGEAGIDREGPAEFGFALPPLIAGHLNETQNGMRLGQIVVQLDGMLCRSRRLGQSSLNRHRTVLGRQRQDFR